MSIQTESLQLQGRDVSLLRGLFESRVMTAKHVTALYFENKGEYAKKRLQKLKAAGFIGGRKRQVNRPSILFLTRKGFHYLNDNGQLSEFPPFSANSFEARASVSDLTLRHELEVMDVKTAFHSALVKSDKFSIIQFSTWPVLHQFTLSLANRANDTPVKPDGFIRIHEKEAGTKGFVHDCFLEVDRSSKDQGRLIEQAGRYREYYRSGGFAVRNGASRTAFEDFPLRVLMILKSAERRNNTAERLAHHNPPILTQVWLTTFDEVTADPLAAIWILPADYRAVTKSTQFYDEHPHRRFEYHRNPVREAFIESNIKRHRLLEDGIAA